MPRWPMGYEVQIYASNNPQEPQTGSLYYQGGSGAALPAADEANSRNSTQWSVSVSSVTSLPLSSDVGR